MPISPDYMNLLMAMASRGGGAGGPGGGGGLMNRPSQPYNINMPSSPGGGMGIMNPAPEIGGSGMTFTQPFFPNPGGGPPGTTAQPLPYGGSPSPLDLQQPGSPYMGMGQSVGGYPGPSGGIYANPNTPGGMYGVGGGAGGGVSEGMDGGGPVGEIPPGLATFFDSKGYRPMDPYVTEPANPALPPNVFHRPNPNGGPMGGPMGGSGGGMNRGGGARTTPPWAPPTNMKPGGGLNYGPPAIRRPPGRGGIAAQPPSNGLTGNRGR